MKKALTICMIGLIGMISPISSHAQSIASSVKAMEKEMKKAEKAAEKAAKAAEKNAGKSVSKAVKSAEKAVKATEKTVKATAKTAGKAITATPVTAIPKPAVKKTPDNLTPEVIAMCKKPELKDGGDSIAYIFGAFQSAGLKPYLSKQMGVDTAYMEDFYKGILAHLNIDPSDKKAIAYNAGLNIGGQIENMATNVTKDYYDGEPGKAIDPKIVANSIIAALSGMNEYEPQQANKEFQTAMNAKKEANIAAKYADNKKAGEKFLEENKTKPGVVTLPSGLQYKVITKGSGATPKATDKVTVNYKGTLIDGTEFDSSYKRNKPSSFKCNQVIKGWTEALTMMPVGSKWELYIPQELAYGSRDASKIKPFSALIFEVELLSIEPAKTAAKPAAKSTTQVKPAKK